VFVGAHVNDVHMALPVQLLLMTVVVLRWFPRWLLKRCWLWWMMVVLPVWLMLLLLLLLLVLLFAVAGVADVNDVYIYAAARAIVAGDDVAPKMPNNQAPAARQQLPFD
jgi:hypothetical protein